MKTSSMAIVMGVLAASLATTLIVPFSPAAAAPVAQKITQPGMVGYVKDTEGKAMAGVAVSARSSESTFTTSVYTDEKGKYVFPCLTAGKFQVWAQAVKFTTQRDEVVLDGLTTAELNLTLKPLKNYEQQLTGAEWFDALPNDTRDHRRLKQVLYVACTGCHGLDVVLQNRFDEAGWKAILKAMESSWYSGWRGASDLPPHQLRWEAQIMRHHHDELAKYLAEMRGPEKSPMKLKPLARPTGDAARAVITEYDLPISSRENELPWYNGADWMFGPSTGMHGMVGTHDVAVDAQGNAWISHSGGRSTFESNRTMTKLDPKTGEMTAFKFFDERGKIVPVEQISSVGPNGEIWMHSDDSFIRLEPESEKFTAFPIPKVMGVSVNSTDIDSKGRVWANGLFGAIKFDQNELSKTGVAYPGWHLYQQHTPGDGITYGISADADDNIWWSESYIDKVATRDMKTGKVTEIDMRDPEYNSRKSLASVDLEFYDSIGGGTWSTNSASPLPYANMPRRLAADKNGHTVWVPNWAQSSIAEIDIHTKKVTYHRLPITVHPYKTIVDKNHNVWTDTSLADAALKFNPTSGQWTVYRLPSHGCGSRHMGFDDYRGEAWIACDQASKVVRIQFRTAEELR